MDTSGLFELVVEAVGQALREDHGGVDTGLSPRLIGGKLIFEDNEGRTAKEVDISVLLRKITAVREKLRVLEQKINNHSKLDTGDKAELQTQLTRCYGSLTTFNFLFHDEHDKFKGSGR